MCDLTLAYVLSLSQCDDLLNCDYGEGVHVITDKGTLDAVGLSNNPVARWTSFHPASSGMIALISFLAASLAASAKWRTGTVCWNMAGCAASCDGRMLCSTWIGVAVLQEKVSILHVALAAPLRLSREHNSMVVCI